MTDRETIRFKRKVDIIKRVLQNKITLKRQITLAKMCQLSVTQLWIITQLVCIRNTSEYSGA